MASSRSDRRLDVILFAVSLAAVWTSQASAQGPGAPPRDQSGYGQPSAGTSQVIPLPQPGAAQAVYPPTQPVPPQPNSPQPTSPQPQAALGPQQPPAAGAPFILSAAEQTQVDQVLAVWEAESAKINIFENTFTRWEYDPLFGPADPTIAMTKSEGKVRYKKPDQGEFRIDEIRRYDVSTQELKPQKDEAKERWVCDGQAIYEFNAAQKQLIIRKLPPELQGKAITDGPLPFLFGAEAAKLKQRYYIRILPNTNQSEIWLEAYPRFQQDAMNFQRVELILDRQKFLPSAMQIYSPNGKSRTVYKFDVANAKINGGFLQNMLSGFGPLTKPLGWKTINEPIPEPTPAQTPH